MFLIGLREEKQAGPPRSPPYESDSIAPVKSLDDPRMSRKSGPDLKISPSTLKMEAIVLQSQPLHPISHKSLQMPQEKAGVLT